MSSSTDCELIRYQVDLLNRELSDVAPLLETITVRPPDSIEIRAVGAVLQAAGCDVDRRGDQSLHDFFGDLRPYPVQERQPA